MPLSAEHPAIIHLFMLDVADVAERNSTADEEGI